MYSLSAGGRKHLCAKRPKAANHACGSMPARIRIKKTPGNACTAGNNHQREQTRPRSAHRTEISLAAAQPLPQNPHLCNLILRASRAKSGRYAGLPGLETQPARLLQRTASFKPLQGLTSTGHNANAYMHLWQATTGASQSGAPCAEVCVSALLCFHQGHSPRALAGSLVPRDPPNACRGEQYVHNPPEVQAGAHHRAAPHV